MQRSSCFPSSRDGAAVIGYAADMSDEYWTEHRSSYVGVSEAFEELAAAGKREWIRTATESDEIREGIEINSSHEFFPRVSRWLTELGRVGTGPWSYIKLRPDPYKSPGFWRLAVSGQGYVELYVTHDDVKKL